MGQFFPGNGKQNCFLRVHGKVIQEECIIRKQLVDFDGEPGKIPGGMIDGDCKSRAELPDRLCSTLQGSELGTLNIHLDEVDPCGFPVPDKIIDRHGDNLTVMQGVPPVGLGEDARPDPVCRILQDLTGPVPQCPVNDPD